MAETRDSRSGGVQYDAPRAVRLSDATTGTFSCFDGTQGTIDMCQSGFAVQPHNICSTGSSVSGF